MERSIIINYCQKFLETDKFTDYCHNGLQVEGRKEIKKIITGVSLSKKLIAKALEKKSDMIIVHHGLFGNTVGQPPVVKGYIAGRIKMLLANDINLAGFHLPLDAHPLIGNNISLCRLLGVLDPKPFDVGFIGNIKKTGFTEFVKMVNKKLNTNSYVIKAGPKSVNKVAIISGGSSPDFELAASLGADVFLGGDIRESVVEAVEETGINFINAGHYNTEKLGIHNLGNLIAKKFKVQVEFVDIPCEI